VTTRTEPAWIDTFYETELQELEYGVYYADRSRSAWQAALIVKFLAIDHDSLVLDLACGRGRHALHVAERAGKVVGTDRSPDAIRSAAERAARVGTTNVIFEVEDMRDLDRPNTFDAAYNYYTSWGYYSDEEDLDVLVRVCRALRQGGRFLLELVARDSLARIMPERDFGLLSDGTVVTVECTFDPATGRCHSRRTYHLLEANRIIEVSHHVPAPDHLAHMFRLAGFGDIELFDGVTGGELTLASPRVIVVGRKP
jgi:SAM-dependent methyltransferase